MLIFIAVVILSLSCNRINYSEDAKYYRKINKSEFIDYGDTPSCHTIYVGSDDSYHYFVWSSGKIGGRWKVSKADMPFRQEYRKGEKEAFLIRDNWGNIQPYLGISN
jgi:hypothetical protein